MNANSAMRMLASGYGKPRAIAGLLAGLWAMLTAAVAGTAITNVTVANVTPSSFSVVWRSFDSTPSIQIYADAAGASNITARFGIEAFPIRTGSATASSSYERRASVAALQSKSRGFGVMQIRVAGCLPSTTYYYRIASTADGSPPVNFPASGALPSVTTPAENTFVINSQQFLLDVPGVDTDGEIVLLSHTNGAYPVAAVVGDGAGTNQVFLNISDLFAASGAGNLALQGPQTFTAQLFGSDSLIVSSQFTIVFGTSFSVAQANHQSLGIEYLAIDLGTTLLQTGQASSIPVSFQSDAQVADISVNLGIPTGYLTGFNLQSLAPAIDPASSSIVRVVGTNYLLHLKTKPGQTLTGNQDIAAIGFNGIPGANSAFVPIDVTAVSGAKLDSTPVGHPQGSGGQVTLVGSQPLLVDDILPNGSHHLTMYAQPWSGYEIDSNSDPSGAGTWRFVMRVPATNLVTTFTQLPHDSDAKLYRAEGLVTDPPIVDAINNPDHTRKLLIYGLASKQYNVQYRTNFQSDATWHALVTTAALTNGFQYVPIGNTNATVYYRLTVN